MRRRLSPLLLALVYSSAVSILDTICVSFPLAAITNPHQLSGLAQHRFLSHRPGGQKPDTGLPGPPSKCQQSCVPF